MAAGGEGDMPRSGSPACSTTLAEMDHNCPAHALRGAETEGDDGHTLRHKGAALLVVRKAMSYGRGGVSLCRRAKRESAEGQKKSASAGNRT